MCYYITKIYQYEILKMKCEFVKDIHGTIWFYHASQILARQNMLARKTKEAVELQKYKMNKERTEQLNIRIKKHLEEQEKEGKTFAS